MKPPRLRFTVRRVMVAVAAIALVMYGSRLYQWSRVHRHEAREYAVEECFVEVDLAGEISTRDKIRDALAGVDEANAASLLAALRDQEDRMNSKAQDLAAVRTLKREHERAAWLPWATVQRDPRRPAQ